MRILVTGREGQVARSIAERVRGHELVFAARPELDLTEPDTIRDQVRRVAPDLIVSAAAYTAVDRAEDDPDTAHAVNAVAPGVLAAAAREIDAPIIHLSTDYVFDGTADRPYREDDPTAPLGVYGATKHAGEGAVRAAGGRSLILRTAWVYSPFGANFVKTMLRLAGDRDTVSVVADQRGCPTSALDIADAIGRVAEQAWQGGTYHLAGNGEASWADFATAIFAASAALDGPTATVKPIATADYPTRAQRPANSRLDSSAFAATFGYSAPLWSQSLLPVVERLARAGASR